MCFEHDKRGRGEKVGVMRLRTIVPQVKGPHHMKYQGASQSIAHTVVPVEGEGLVHSRKPADPCL